LKWIQDYVFQSGGYKFKFAIVFIGLLMNLSKILIATLQKCKMDAVSTIDSQNCYIKATTAWDIELGNQYKLLMKDQPENVRAALRDSQRQWIKYKRFV
jgi:uncharacterized protein YecT (DUF1311 family)